MKAVVSVIVPVYKVEHYLDKCVKSLVSQTYRELEIILVDDQSPDRSPQLCDCWAERDSRIRVIHKPREGVGRARNTGLEAATGSYIMFADSDDYLPEDAVEVLLERLTADGSDMAVGRNLQVFEDGHTNGRPCAFMKDKLLSGEDFLNAVGAKEGYPSAPWGKIYTRRTLEGIAFPPLICGQDLWLFPLIILRCETISVVDHLVYYYVQRPTSTTHTPKDHYRLSAIEAHQHMVDIFLQRGQLDWAANWLKSEIDLVGEMTVMKDGVDFVKSNLDPELLRKLLHRCSLRVRGKWFLVQHPAAFRCVMVPKRKLSAFIIHTLTKTGA